MKDLIGWLVGELLSNATVSIVISVVYDKEKNEARIFLNGKKIATISEKVSVFGWVLSNEQITRLREAYNEGERRADER